ERRVSVVFDSSISSVPDTVEVNSSEQEAEHKRWTVVSSHFVDRNMDVLIQRVALVMPLADVLLSKKMLSYEAYSEIKAERTSQRQMRALYKVLEAGGFAAKNAVLDALKEQNPYLVQELDDQSVFTEPENKYQTADVKGNARLGDFGISRRLNRGVSTRCTTKAGTKGWEAAEILDSENQGEAQCRYKKSSDIQVAGMLVYYILSDGHHPFGKSRRVEVNIMEGKYSLQEITDVEAKDLVKEMIQKDPKQRVTIEEALGHPYFWDDERRDAFLRKVAGEKAVQSFSSADEKLRSVVAKYTEGRTFSSWKSKVPQELSPDPKLPDDLLGLLRFLRNILVHKADVFEKNNMFKDLFPDFFISAHKLAKEMGWKA
ncbi:hypothetical protein NFI96_019067, partial [Prochilodus magdalenae]